MADGTRTLAPRGWCRSGRYGSDGSVASVTPDAATLRPLMAGVIADTRRTHAIAPSTGQR